MKPDTSNAGSCSIIWFLSLLIMPEAQNELRSQNLAETHLVNLKLVAVGSGVTWWAGMLAASAGHSPFNTSGDVIVTRPCQYQPLIQDWLSAAIPYLFLDLVGHVESTSPDLHFTQVALEALLSERLYVVRSWLTEHNPSTASVTKT